MIPAIARVVLVDRERYPQVALVRVVKPRRHYSDHYVIGATESEGLTNKRGIRSETAAPKRVADQNDLVAARLIFVFTERSSLFWLDAQYREEAGVDGSGVHSNGFAAAREVRAAGLI